ncbi:MAG: hypothetical protein EOP11_07790 [Proteobacteria bacterium]|nr:MAG: hypothetical protein EOP11_07790 [Pseudomonadota bacterium]
MKTLFALLPLLAILSSSAFAGQVKGENDVQIGATEIDGFQAIPRVGDLNGSVVSVYAGSAFALENYYVTVGNTAAACEGDDCVASKTFILNGYEGQYQGAATAVYSRQIDKNTYSIAIMTSVLDPEGIEEGKPVPVKAKILLTVKFTKEGVAEIAEESVVDIR